MTGRSTAPGELQLKRIYDPVAKQDGLRVLVDRLWPRAVSREQACIDHWLPQVAPSHPLRRWFGHDPQRWPEFQRRYRAELAGNRGLDELITLAAVPKITLLYGARDRQHNQAVVLAQLLSGEGGEGADPRFE